MARLFRSKSCSLGTRTSMPPVTTSPNSPSLNEDEDGEEDEDEGYFGDFNSDEDDGSENPATTPFISPARNARNNKVNHNQSQFSVLAAALWKSLVTCSAEADDVASDVDIGWPIDVRHVSHVTFDRFNGFLGLPVELQPDVPRKPPSASSSVFGVSAQLMHCSYDHRGNIVPTILLMMQSRLYSEAGLQVEGIFGINAENSKEENVPNQLNKGVVPHTCDGINVHCLSGLIKGYALQHRRRIVKLFPPTESALLDWAINLMADVVQHGHHNKMNARNIAMVFAPNMTQKADPLTTQIHTVQVMNFLKTLITKTLRQRQKSSAPTLITECTDSFEKIEGPPPSNTTEVILSCKEAVGSDNLLRSCILERLELDNNSLSIRSKSVGGEKYECALGGTSPVMRKRRTLGHSFKDEYDNMEDEGILNRISLRKGLRRHPVFQLSKVVNT